MGSTSTTTKTTRDIVVFFVLTFVLSLPVYVLAALVPPEMVMIAGLLLTLAPISAALILTFRQNQSTGAKKLLKRAFDYKRITHGRWYLPILFLWPVFFSLVLLLLNLMGEPFPDSALPIVATPVILFVFFFLALAEEIGWMGYAYDSMENRWNALISGIVLGVIWAAWHLPIFIHTPFGSTWIIGQIFTLALSRILYVWIFNNTAKSVFAAILFHAVYNVCTMMFPVYGSPLGPVLTAAIVLISVVIVILFWGRDTLAKFKFSKQE